MTLRPETHETAPCTVFSATPLRRYSTSGCQFGMARAKLGAADSSKDIRGNSIGSADVSSAAVGRLARRRWFSVIERDARSLRARTPALQAQQLTRGHELISHVTWRRSCCARYHGR